MSWLVAAAIVIALALVGLWLLRSFRRWPPTDDERTSFLWGRRGGGDF